MMVFLNLAFLLLSILPSLSLAAHQQSITPAPVPTDANGLRIACPTSTVTTQAPVDRIVKCLRKEPEKRFVCPMIRCADHPTSTTTVPCHCPTQVPTVTVGSGPCDVGVGGGCHNCDPVWVTATQKC